MILMAFRHGLRVSELVSLVAHYFKVRSAYVIRLKNNLVAQHLYLDLSGKNLQIIIERRQVIEF